MGRDPPQDGGSRRSWRVGVPAGPRQVLPQGRPGGLPKAEPEPTSPPGQGEAQELGLPVPEVDRRPVFALEGKSGVGQEVAGAAEGLQAFGHAPARIRQVVGVAEPGRVG